MSVTKDSESTTITNTTNEPVTTTTTTPLPKYITDSTASRSQSPAKRLKSEDLRDEGIDAVMTDDADLQLQRESSTAETTEADDAATITTMTSSTAPTSVAESTTPNKEEQVETVKAGLIAQLKEGEEYYVISLKWLRRFIGEGVSKEETGLPVGRIDNSDIIDTEEMRGLEKIKSDASISSDDEDFVPLKQGQLGQDFEVLPAKTWHDLVNWYGLADRSPIIRRKVVNTAEPPQKELQVELYPPLFTVYRIRDPGSQVTRDSLKEEKEQRPRKIVVGRSEGFQKFLKKVKKITGVDPARKARIWRLNNIPEPEKGKKDKKNPFKQMILDLQAFLEQESERELLDIPDRTNDAKYNGHMDIGTAGLGTGGIIIVEEQSADGDWVSTSPVKTTNRFGEVITVLKNGIKSATTEKKARPNALQVKNDKEKEKQASRSSSPSKSITSRVSNVFTRNRTGSGRTMGTCGLSNLGNTCYMNSALQCLRSVEELSKYFLTDEYEKELNPGNPLAHHGKVAKAYAQLLKNIFASSSPSSYAPREFKSTIGRFGPSFSGYQQQDSQEFLAFLLDGLHEDLNRIDKKPYIERPDSTDDMVGNPEKIAQLAATHWDIYKKRNDSAVADLFAGLYKSTLVCPECSKVSITFDPFMDLTLPLPIESLWSNEVIWYPLEKKKGFQGPFKVPVEMAKHASIKSLKELLGKKYGVDPRKIMGSELYKNKFYKHYTDDMTVSDAIHQNDVGVFYELEDVPTNYPGPKKKVRSMLSYGSEEEDVRGVTLDSPEYDKLMVPIFHRYGKGGWNHDQLEYFGMPSFITLDRNEQHDYEAIVDKVIQRVKLMTTKDLDEAAGLKWEHPETAIDPEILNDDGSSVENVNKPEIRLDKPDEEKDGFVDVSMQDAESADEEPVKAASSASPKSRIPLNQVADLFEIKFSAVEGVRIPTGFSGGLKNIFRLSDRINNVAPVKSRSTSPVRSLLNHFRGPRTPVSEISDGEDMFAPDSPRIDPEMQDASDIESGPDGEGSYATSTQGNGLSFGPVNATNFYSGSPVRPSPSPRALSPVPPPHELPQKPKQLIQLGEALIIDWKDSGYDALFAGTSYTDHFRGTITFDDKNMKLPTDIDPELERTRRRRADRRAKGIHLEDCLDEFAKEEILSADDPWYCPKCKEHRRASKKFELWKCPDVLVIHLKRFSSSRSFRDKIDALVECPIEGLDLGRWVGATDETQKGGMVYDLCAVDNHYGGLGGGHYTAYVRNWVDGKWYYCDDSSVRESQPSAVITPAAYLLFYRRRSTTPLGGPHFGQILTKAAEAAAAARSDDENPLSPSSSTKTTPSKPRSMLSPLLPRPLVTDNYDSSDNDDGLDIDADADGEVDDDDDDFMNGGALVHNVQLPRQGDVEDEAVEIGDGGLGGWNTGGVGNEMLWSRMSEDVEDPEVEAERAMADTEAGGGGEEMLPTYEEVYGGERGFVRDEKADGAVTEETKVQDGEKKVEFPVKVDIEMKDEEPKIKEVKDEKDGGPEGGVRL